MKFISENYSFNLTVNTLLSHYKYQLVDALRGKKKIYSEKSTRNIDIPCNENRQLSALKKMVHVFTINI
jgi:hypothetical protein